MTSAGVIIGDVLNDGIVRLDDGADQTATASIAGNYSQSSIATLEIDLFGDGSGAWDNLEISGDFFTLGGLELQLSGTFYRPRLGDKFPHIVSAARINDAFTSVKNVAIDRTIGYAVTYTDTTIDVEVALLGDADLDGTVAFGDFVRLANQFSSAGAWATGDFDGNGKVEFADFALLAGNFGATAATASAVPEPCHSFVLCAVLANCLFRRRRSR